MINYLDNIKDIINKELEIERDIENVTLDDNMLNREEVKIDKEVDFENLILKDYEKLRFTVFEIIEDINKLDTGLI